MVVYEEEGEEEGGEEEGREEDLSGLLVGCRFSGVTGHGHTRVSSDSDSASDSACRPGDERGDGSGVAAASWANESTRFLRRRVVVGCGLGGGLSGRWLGVCWCLRGVAVAPLEVAVEMEVDGAIIKMASDGCGGTEGVEG